MCRNVNNAKVININWGQAINLLYERSFLIMLKSSLHGCSNTSSKCIKRHSLVFLINAQREKSQLLLEQMRKKKSKITRKHVFAPPVRHETYKMVVDLMSDDWTANVIGCILHTLWVTIGSINPAMRLREERWQTHHLSWRIFKQSDVWGTFKMRTLKEIRTKRHQQEF